MKFYSHINVKNIAASCIVAMFFSCGNNSKEVNNFLITRNLPIGVAKNTKHIYKDSGRVTLKLITPLLKDFSNRTEHPYNEFPEGIKLITFENKEGDSITILGDYALTYTKTLISELKGDVVIVNHKDQSKLYTDQLFWDQNTDYFFSERKFKYTNPTDTIYGVGFESKKDLSKFSAKQTTGALTIKE